MEERVSTVDVSIKKDFIKWMLKRYRMKRRETVWVLNYISTHDQILKNVIFVDNIDTVDTKNKKVRISSVCSDKLSFLFIEDKNKTNDVEKLFHSIRTNPTDVVYVQIDYKDISACPIYASVNELHNSDQGLSPEVLKEAAQIMAEIEQKMVLNEIDKALDKSDHNAFMELWEIYNNIKETKFTNAT